jgi:hypothetical protein
MRDDLFINYMEKMWKVIYRRCVNSERKVSLRLMGKLIKKVGEREVWRRGIKWDT